MGIPPEDPRATVYNPAKYKEKVSLPRPIPSLGMLLALALDKDQGFREGPTGSEYQARCGEEVMA